MKVCNICGKQQTKRFSKACEFCGKSLLKDNPIAQKVVPSIPPPTGKTPVEEPEVELESGAKPKLKKCPFCAEEIKFEAVKCRFCGERFNSIDVFQILSEDRENFGNIPQEVSPLRTTFYFFIGIGIIYYFVSLNNFSFNLDYFSNKSSPSQNSNSYKDTNSSESSALKEVINSIQKLVSATEVGINFIEFGKILVQVKGEVDTARDQIINSDKRNKIDRCLECYIDALEVWRKKINGTSFFQNNYSGDWEYVKKHSFEALAMDHNDPFSRKPVKVVFSDHLIKALFAKGSGIFRSLKG